MKKTKVLATIIILVLVISCIPFSPVTGVTTAAPAFAANPIYLDESYSYPERAADLVARMTLKEKASQVAGYNSSAIPRLGIAGYMWWNEALHGYSQEGWFGAQADGASYPSSYSVGASWNPELYYEEAVEIGAEIRERVRDNRYNLTMFSPTVNLARDPRWGRNDESYGEDPFLVGLMGSSFVKGVEGKNIDGSYKLTNQTSGEGIKQAVTTTKHYAANNTERNRYTSGADNITQREFREYYTRPYGIVAENADMSSVMMAYSSINGVPISFSSYFMDTLLRQTYGFSGYIVSDCDSVATSYNRNVHSFNPHTGRGYVLGEAFANAMASGLDLQCNAGETDGLGSYGTNFKVMLGDGTVKTDKGLFTEQQLEISVHRAMTKRMQLGEFDAKNDYAAEGKARLDEGNASEYVNGVIGQTQERIDIADEVSRETIVLLKNENDAADNPALPITSEEIIGDEDTYKVGIIGPVGQSNFRGGYSSRLSNESNLVTIEQAIRREFNDPSVYPENVRAKLDVKYHYGYSSNVSRSNFTGLRADQISLTNVEPDLDLAIIVVGQGQGDSREDGDRTNLSLAPAQVELIRRVKALNPKKVVLVMETYGPVQMEADIVNNADAILWSSFNGFRKGTGFGEAITGKTNPSGRTNTTWLKDMINDTPGFFDYQLFPRVENGEEIGGRTYMYNAEDTIYPFGYGLSYADVTYSKANGQASMLGADAAGGLTLGGAESITKDSVINVTFNIANTNNTAGKQVAEVYAVSPNPDNDPTIPKKRLVGFEKVDLGANASKTVTIPVKVADLALFDEANDCYVLPEGAWQLWVARSSDLNPAADLFETFTVANGDIREDPDVVTVKPTQAGDSADENGVSERVIFDLGANDAENTILPNIAVSMVNEKLYGTRVINNLPGTDIGVDPAEVTGPWDEPDSAAAADRIDEGKDADALPKIGEAYPLSSLIARGYTVQYASNRPEIVQIGNEAAPGVFSDGAVVMKSRGVATVIVKVTAPSGEYATTDFVVYVQDEAGLTDITVGGTSISDFSGNTLHYTCAVPADTAANSALLTVKAQFDGDKTVTYSTTDDGSGTIGYTADILGLGVNPDAIPGKVYIKVSQPGHLDQLYVIQFAEAFKPVSFVNGTIDDKWTVVNANPNNYEAVKGLGLRLATATGSLANGQNLFLRPGAGDWTVAMKVYFPRSSQQLQLLAYQDNLNYVRLNQTTGRSMSMAPMIGGASNGSISTATGIPANTPFVMYYKLQRQGYAYTAWYSLDGLNYNRVQSADGRRAGETSRVDDVQLGLFATGSNGIDIYCEFIDALSLNGMEVKTDQDVLNDAFEDVVASLADGIPKEVSDNIRLSVPFDYTLRFESDSPYIAEDGTVTRPETQDATANVKILLTHPNAEIEGDSEVIVYDGPIKVKAPTTTVSVDKTALAAGETVNATAAIVNATGDALSANLIMAIYSDDGSLEDVVIKNDTIAPGTGTIQSSIQLPEDVIGKTLSVFLWDAGSWIPIAEKTTIQ